MKIKTWRTPSLLASLLLLFLLTACTADRPVRFYTLPDSRAPGTQSPGPVVSEAAVAVGPVTLPDYVNRPEIVTRAASGEVYIAESDRWAGPLEDDITRVLTEDVSAGLRSMNIAAVSWRRPVQTRVRVPVTIVRLDAIQGRRVWIEAQWTVRTAGGAAEGRVYEGTFEAPAPGPGYQGIASGISTAIGQLGEKIVQSLAGILARQAG
jgi:uncharacterized protein